MKRSHDWGLACESNAYRKMKECWSRARRWMCKRMKVMMTKGRKASDEQKNIYASACLPPATRRRPASHITITFHAR